jgi:hypothetical protein
MFATGTVLAAVAVVDVGFAVVAVELDPATVVDVVVDFRDVDVVLAALVLSSSSPHATRPVSTSAMTATLAMRFIGPS